MERLKRSVEDIPLPVINVISILSGLLTIISFLVTVIGAFFSKPDIVKYSGICFGIFTVFFGWLYWKKLIKYRELAKDRLTEHSRETAHANEEIKNTLFDVLHHYKAGQLTPELLESTIKAALKSLLDSLVRIMEVNTCQDINACIKLILPSETEITIDNAQIQTFVRSTKGETMRSTYDVNNPQPVYIKDNTDFLEIFSNSAVVFYEGNLIEYEKRLEQLHKHYLNTHVDWKDFYRGTIVVPISIQHKFLHFTKQDNNYQIVGFLCVDSMSTEAFLPRQKTENTEFLQAFASLSYILLNKYQYYLNKLIAQAPGGDADNGHA